MKLHPNMKHSAQVGNVKAADLNENKLDKDFERIMNERRMKEKNVKNT